MIEELQKFENLPAGSKGIMMFAEKINELVRAHNSQIKEDSWQCDNREFNNAHIPECPHLKWTKINGVWAWSALEVKKEPVEEWPAPR